MENSYPIELFIDRSHAESFVCLICQTIPTGPNLSDHGKCGSIFCFSCISIWLKHKKTCPKCIEPFGKLGLSRDQNKAIYNILQSLKIHCPWDKACEWIGEYSDLEKHLKEEKEKSDIQECKYKHIGCKIRGTKLTMDQHLVEHALDHAEKNFAYITELHKEYEALKVKYNTAIAENTALKQSGNKLYKEVPSVNPVVYLTISINASTFINLIFELQANIVPKTAENFRMLCLGFRTRATKKFLSYKGNNIHRIIPSFILQGGDVVNGNGTGCISIYGGSFADENFIIKHDSAGILSMANAGPNTNGCQFFVTLKAVPHLNGKNVAFGRVIEGIECLKKMEVCGTPTGETTAELLIHDSGQIY